MYAAGDSARNKNNVLPKVSIVKFNVFGFRRWRNYFFWIVNSSCYNHMPLLSSVNIKESVLPRNARKDNDSMIRKFQKGTSLFIMKLLLNTDAPFVEYTHDRRFQVFWLKTSQRMWLGFWRLTTWIWAFMVNLARNIIKILVCWHRDFFLRPSTELEKHVRCVMITLMCRTWFH